VEENKMRRLKESKVCAWCVLLVCVVRHVLIGEFTFGITPGYSSIRQVNKRDFILVELLGVLGCLV